MRSEVVHYIGKFLQLQTRCYELVHAAFWGSFASKWLSTHVNRPRARALVYDNA